jgi:hypothetical protein
MISQLWASELVLRRVCVLFLDDHYRDAVVEVFVTHRVAAYIANLILQQNHEKSNALSKVM